MEIQVGEFIRTKDGIKKIIKVNEGSNATYYGKYIVEPKYKGSNSINAKNIIKHSFNIIDLIEVGDYVNGYKVKEIYVDGFGKNLWFRWNVKSNDYWQGNKKIKSIATKEQFKAMEYEEE